MKFNINNVKNFLEFQKYMEQIEAMENEQPKEEQKPEEPKPEQPKQEEQKPAGQQEEPKQEEVKQPAPAPASIPPASPVLAPPATAPAVPQKSLTVSEIIAQNPEWFKDPNLEAQVKRMVNQKALLPNP